MSERSCHVLLGHPPSLAVRASFLFKKLALRLSLANWEMEDQISSENHQQQDSQEQGKPREHKRILF
jgi:hypothetical protein